MKKMTVFQLMFVSAAFLSGCEKDMPQIANPASVFCKDKGGMSRIVTREDGAQYGVCIFEDNRVCEEWALMRRECPVGGVKITGYTTDKGTYCAIRGGKPMDNETKCMTHLGKICDVEEFYYGRCGQAGQSQK